MTIGISLNVGLNKVTSSVFQAPVLKGCENDAIKMHDITINQRGFDADLSTVLLGSDATLDKVVNAVKAAAEKLQDGDLFLFTFAGHGTFKVVPESQEEPDGHDESIVLADHLLIDNFWRRDLWPSFKPGVRVVAIADCCHSGSALSSDELPSEEEARRSGRATREGEGKPAMRGISEGERQKELLKFPDLYARQLEQTGNEIVCKRLFLSACEDEQTAADGPEHGAFTNTFLQVWDNGNFRKSYAELMDQIRVPFLNTRQTPQINAFDNLAFIGEEALKI
jgi:hypothetical protein